MKKHVIFSRLSLLLPILSLLIELTPATSTAQIISPNGTEVNFSYTASFEIPTTARENTDEKRMKLHASYMFGIFQSPTFIRQLGLDPELSAGIGAPRAQTQFTILSSEQVSDKIKISYTAASKMLPSRGIFRWIPLTV